MKVGIPSPETLERAREAVRASRARDDYRNYGPTWVGYIGQYAAAEWARRQDLDVEENGGIDGLPDLVINGHPIGVKTRGTIPHPDLDVYIQERQLEKPYGYWIFAAVQTVRPFTTYLLGAITPRRFLELADPRPNLGTPLCRGLRASVLPLTALDLRDALTASAQLPSTGSGAPSQSEPVDQYDPSQRATGSLARP